MIQKVTNIVDVLNKISDLKFQREVWLEGKYWDRVSSFEEAVNTLEDYKFFDDVKENKIGLSEEDKVQVDLFVKKLNEYDVEDVTFMLNDSKWEIIVSLAKKTNEILDGCCW